MGTDRGKAPGANGGTASLFTNGATLSVAYGVGKCDGCPITTGPSIIADPFIFNGPSPTAGAIPVHTLSCPPTTA